jgi:hypothetical protein
MEAQNVSSNVVHTTNHPVLVSLTVFASFLAVASLFASVYLYAQQLQMADQFAALQEQMVEVPTVVQTESESQTVTNVGPSFEGLGISAPPAVSDREAYASWAAEYGVAITAYNKENGIDQDFTEEAVMTGPATPEEEAEMDRLQESVQVDN